MPPIPVKLPEGLFKNGTPYSRKGRWSDANLVRWHDGSVRPIGGWGRRTSGGTNIATLIADPTAEAVRDMFAWRSNNQNQNTVFGSNLGIYHMSQGGVITDITPGAYAPVNSEKDAASGAGYGQNPYGTGAYGSENAFEGQDPTPPDRWYFDNFGEVLLFGSRNNGDMFELDNTLLTTSVVSGAPTQVQDICVTDQRQVMAIGGDGEPRRVQSSEIEDRTNWTAATDNQVIDRTLPGTGRLLRCIPVMRSTLILGENDAHVARYIGPPYVQSIDLIGENCGPIAAEAVATTDRFAVWWGERTFWIYDGTVQKIECDVIDWLYRDIEKGQVSKITAFSNTDFNEVWWLYQSSSSTTTEVDSYVVWNYVKKTWNTGRIDRTAGYDKGVLLYPVMVDSDGYIYNHELQDTLPDGDIYVTTGPIDLSNGEKNIGVRFIWPDTEATSDVTFELLMKQFPNVTEYTYGPYAYNNPIPTTGALGRQCRVKATFQQAWAELGVFRLETALPQSGTGRR